jgi:hypothetical protein
VIPSTDGYFVMGAVVTGPGSGERFGLAVPGVSGWTRDKEAATASMQGAHLKVRRLSPPKPFLEVPVAESAKADDLAKRVSQVEVVLRPTTRKTSVVWNWHREPPLRTSIPVAELLGWRLCTKDLVECSNWLGPAFDSELQTLTASNESPGATP